MSVSFAVYITILDSFVETISENIFLKRGIIVLPFVNAEIFLILSFINRGSDTVQNPNPISFHHVSPL